jgi:hypothetical protein
MNHKVEPRKLSGLLAPRRAGFVCLLSGVAAIACTAPEPAPQECTAGDCVAGIVPEGIWVLDHERARGLVPSARTLWIVKDDGKTLAWVSIETDADGKDRITTWTGEYGGAPATVSGSGMVASLRATGPHAMETFGEIPGLGAFSEKCEVQASGKRMRCNGEVSGPDGTRQWYEEFELKGPSPHKPHRQAAPDG